MTTNVEWEKSFVQRFIYAQGKTDIPKSFLRFTAISLLSAVLQNKVWVELYKGDPLYPNLYTFLVGPSGVGKGRAISAGIRLLEDSGMTEYVGLKGGTMTSASVIDFLSSKQGTLRPGTSRAYLVMPELSSSIKWGEHSDALVKRMTDLFTGDLSNYEDSTRTGGVKRAGRPCVSWLGGSTRRWLITNLKADALAGGFMARGLFIEVFKKPARIFLPEYPPDYTQVLGQLQLQLATQIYNLEGPFTLQPDTLEFLKDWYMNRPQPKSEEAQASWNRHRELSLKLAMVLSASIDSSRIIEVDHLYEAITLVEEVKATESELWNFIIAGGKTIDLEFVAQRISLTGEITHSDLVRQVSGRGILAKKLWELLAVLEQQGRIETKRTRFKGLVREREIVSYRWKAERPSIARLRIEEDTE